MGLALPYSTAMRIAALSCLLLLIASLATAEPIPSGAIQVIDGDTISSRGRTVRAVHIAVDYVTIRCITPDVTFTP